MELKPGKLYCYPHFYLMIYSTKERAEHADILACAGHSRWRAEHSTDAAAADYWSEKLDCQVRSGHPGGIFILLGSDKRFLHILFGDKLGWIIYKDWMMLKEAQYGV